MSFSENAVLTRARAISARRLTNENYRELMNVSGVEEFAEYLSSKTHYSKEFEDVSSVKMNRMMIESLLKRHLTSEYSSLCSFCKILGNKMYRYFVIKNDIEAILSSIRYITTPNKYDIFVSTPTFLNKITSIDMLSLIRSENLAQAGEKLRGTPYFEILTKFQDEDEKTVIIKIENALYDYMYEQSINIAQKTLSKKECEKVRKLLELSSDIRLITSLYRLKKYFSLSGEKIRKYGFKSALSGLSQRQINSMIDAKNCEDFYESVKSTVYYKEFEKKEPEYLARDMNTIRYNLALKTVLYSTHPNEIMICSFFISENEVMNLTHIIESLKYGIDKKDVEKQLIGYNAL